MSTSQKNYSLRGLLIILVVVGHLLTKNPDFFGKNFIYLTIYTFHMPLFLILSGYYGYSVVNKSYPTIIKTVVTSLLLPFFIVSGLYVTLSHFVLGADMRFNYIASPSFAMWFILALVFYRLTTKIVLKIPNYLIVIFIISLFADYFPQVLLNYADFPRILSFMIYYFIGVRIREVDFDLSRVVQRPNSTLLLALLSLGVITYLTINYQSASATVLRQTDVEFFRSLSFAQYVGTGLLAFGLAIINSIIVYSLIQPSNALSYIGKHSFNIYLGHVFFVATLKTSTYQNIITAFPQFVVVIAIVLEATVIIAIILLASERFKRLKTSYLTRITAN